MSELQYIAPGIYAKDRQFHLDVPHMLQRIGQPDTPSNRRRAIRCAFHQLRAAGCQLGGFVLIARQAGIQHQ